MQLESLPAVVITECVAEHERDEALLDSCQPPPVVGAGDVMKRRAQLQDAVGEERPLETKRVPGAFRGELVRNVSGPIGMIEPFRVENRALESERGRNAVDRRVPIFATLCSNEHAAATAARPQEHLQDVAPLVPIHRECLPRPPFDCAVCQRKGVLERARRLHAVEDIPGPNRERFPQSRGNLGAHAAKLDVVDLPLVDVDRENTRVINSNLCPSERVTVARVPLLDLPRDLLRRAGQARPGHESEALLQLVRRVNRRAVYPDALNLGKLRLIPGGWVRGLGEERAGAHQQQAGEQHRSRTDLRCTSHGVRSSGSGTSSTGLKFPSIKR